MLTISLQDILQSPDLPTLPRVAVHALELTADPNADFDELAEVIELDPAMAARVLRTVNSCYYGLGRSCGSIRQALPVLGLKSVKLLVLGFTLVEQIDGGGANDVTFDFLTYWRRQLYSAAAARLIAESSGTVDPEEAFLGALLQDVGMVTLQTTLGDQYLQIVDQSTDDHRGLPTVELKHLGFTHAHVGASMAELWNLPEPLVEAIRHHHDSSAAARPYRPLVEIVELAMSAGIALMSGPMRLPDASGRAAKRPHGVDDDGFSGSLLERITDAAEELSHVLKIDIGEKPDVQDIMQRAASLREKIESEDDAAPAAPRSATSSDQP